TKMAFNPENFQQAAGLVNYYNTENWTALQITWDDEKGRTLTVTTCDNFTFDQPLKDKEITIPKNVEYIYLRVNVKSNIYTYSYSYNGVKWEEIPIEFYYYKHNRNLLPFYSII